jgi:hypothetical protein
VDSAAPWGSYSGPKGGSSSSGDDVETLETALGTEVTVMLQDVADLHVVMLTMVLP